MAEWELRHFVCSLADMGGQRVYFFHNVWGQTRAIEYPEEIQHGRLGKLGESHFRTQQISLHFFLGHLLGTFVRWPEGYIQGVSFFPWGLRQPIGILGGLHGIAKHEQNPRITWALDCLRYLRFWLPHPISQISQWNLIKFQRALLGNPRKTSDPWTYRHPSPTCGTCRTWGLQEQVLDQHAACHEHHRHLGTQLDDAWKERSWLKSARVQAFCLFFWV